MENYEKKYKKAMRKAKKIYRDDNKEIKHYMEVLFPELVESEDERIRKALITYFQKFPYYSIAAVGTNAKEAVAWLEKQGEQKVSAVEFNAKDWYVSKVDGKIHNMTYNPADKVEPKFHEDEKLTDDCNFQYITDMIERYSKYCWDDKFSNDILNWFKSLKNRIK